MLQSRDGSRGRSVAGVSDAYPKEWELDALLRDGTPVHVRPIRPDDEDALVAFHSRLSPHTIYRRFFSPRPVLPPKDVHRFTNVDYHDRMALVAEIGGEMAGVARYDRQTAPNEAEVAFVIEDRHQGRGLGSLLLEHLAGAARERGFEYFVAETLAENRSMLGVFRDAGFVAERRFEDGLIHLRFPIAQTEEALEAMGERERKSSVESMTPILRPRSIAVIGASRKPGSIGHELLRNLLLNEFAGPVFPVNPEATSVAGVPTYPTIGEVPGAVDLAIVTVPAAEVPGVVDACGHKGVRAVLVISGGFAELGEEGRVAEEELVRLARHHGMRLVGPNAMGVVTTMPEVSMNATSSSGQLRRGRVGFLAQSGYLGLAVLEHAAEQGIGFSSFVSVGNRADVSGNDLLQYWEADSDTDVILLYLETFGNPRKFARIARRVGHSKPIVVVKSGRSSASDAATDALFRQAGVIRVDTLAELFDVSLVLAHQPIPRGRRLAIIGNAAGPGVLAADVAPGAGVELATVARGNPIDLTAAATPADVETALCEVIADDAVDAVLVIGVPPLTADLDEVGRALAKAAATHPEKPVIATYLGRRALPGGAVVAGTEAELHPIPVFAFPEQAVRAFGRVAGYGEWRHADEGRVVVPDGVDRGAAIDLADGVLATAPEGRWLTDDETATLLGHAGISLRGAGAGDATPGGLEVVVGVVDHPSFGPLLQFGLGGQAAELLGDVAYRILPLTDTDATRLLRSTRLSPLLFGTGRREPVDEAALVDLLLRVSALADAVPELRELELRPVVASPAGVSVGAGRAHIVPPPTGPGPLLRRLR
jgi:acyl-CoA synthetase (NDP forming)/GNAT superfamily N-acetyltransferase